MKDLPARPLLETQRKNHRSSLVGAFCVAVAATGSIAGVLALITNTVPTLAFLKEAPPLTVTSEISEPKKTTPAPNIPLSFIVSAKPSSPITIPLQPVAPPPVAIASLIPPTPNIPPTDDMEWEVMDFDNPFETKPPIKKAKKTPTKKKTSHVASRTKNTKKSSSKRNTALAKKITKGVRIVSRATPRYPKSARRNKQEGHVVITVTVNASGKVSSSQITRSSNISSLDRAALTAARKFRFQPARNGLGQPVAVKTAIPFTFQITS